MVRNKNINPIAEVIRQNHHQAETFHEVQHHVEDAKKIIEFPQNHPPPLHLEELTSSSR